MITGFDFRTYQPLVGRNSLDDLGLLQRFRRPVEIGENRD
jgi:hypothetical protein